MVRPVTAHVCVDDARVAREHATTDDPILVPVAYCTPSTGASVITDVERRIVVLARSESVGEVKVREIWEEDGVAVTDDEVITRLPDPLEETATN